VSLKTHTEETYRVPQELRSVLRDLIPDLMLSQKHHIHMGAIRNGSGVTSFFLSTVNKLEREEEHCVFIEICCQMYSYIFAVQHSNKLFKACIRFVICSNGFCCSSHVFHLCCWAKTFAA